MQKVPGERYVYKFLPDTMQAVHPFSNQLALGYNQPDGKFILNDSWKWLMRHKIWLICEFVKLKIYSVTWPAHFPNPAVPNAQMPTGFHHPSIHDYYGKNIKTF